jgi:fructosamine-3-kinase
MVMPFLGHGHTANTSNQGMKQKLYSDLSAAIQESTQRPFEIRRAISVGGGSINKAFRLEGTQNERFFLKINDARHYPMFNAEKAGLEAIAATNTLRVPRPIAQGISDDQSYLILENLDLQPHGKAAELGFQLAALHRCTNRQFGFSQDNFIGTTAQQNTLSNNWIDFWRVQRLGFQLQLAVDNGYGSQLQSLGMKLLEILPSFFEDYSPQPSLLHGDLWSGNHAFMADGSPAIFDPAVYFGDRERDIAMTELFGGYPASFYDAYWASWPLDAGYGFRRDLYNLYHILNHVNLFGESYVAPARGLMQRLLSLS